MAAPADGAPRALPAPRWICLRGRGAHAGSGELLLLLELLRLDVADSDRPYAERPALSPSAEPMPNLVPPTRPMVLQLAVLGLRGVRATKQA